MVTSSEVAGNLVGTDPTGTVAMVNEESGVVPAGTAGGIRIDRNVISGNSPYGIEAIDTQGSLEFVGNLIGTDVTGTVAIPNDNFGLYWSIADCTGPCRIGGATAAERNVISGNRGHGVHLTVTSGVSIEGNAIGTDASGTLVLGNGGEGLFVQGSSDVRIGTPGAPNDIAFNGGGGVRGVNLVAARIESGIRSNQSAGIDLVGCSDTFVGAGVIDANLGPGIRIDSDSLRTTVEAATVGRFGSGNVGDGIRIEGGGTVVRSSALRGNRGAGVTVGTTGGGNTVTRCSIAANQGLVAPGSEKGIDLEPAGPNPNDPLDADGGANSGQNRPALASAGNASGLTTVSGSLDSAPARDYRIELFRNASCGTPGSPAQATVFAGSTDVTTDAAGHAAFTASFPGFGGEGLTATATDLVTGDTSEISACVASALSCAASDVRLRTGFAPAAGTCGSGKLTAELTVCSPTDAGFDYRIDPPLPNQLECENGVPPAPIVQDCLAITPGTPAQGSIVVPAGTCVSVVASFDLRGCDPTEGRMLVTAAVTDAQNAVCPWRSCALIYCEGSAPCSPDPLREPGRDAREPPLLLLRRRRRGERPRQRGRLWRRRGRKRAGERGRLRRRRSRERPGQRGRLRRWRSRERAGERGRLRRGRGRERAWERGRLRRRRSGERAGQRGRLRLADPAPAEPLLRPVPEPGGARAGRSGGPGHRLLRDGGRAERARARALRLQRLDLGPRAPRHRPGSAGDPRG